MKYLRFLTILSILLLLGACSDKNDTNPVDNDSSNSSSSNETNISSSSIAILSSSSQDLDTMNLDNIIEDFENEDGKNALGGSWYHYVSPNGNSDFDVARISEMFKNDGNGYNSNGYLSFNYSLDQGSYEWEPYVAVGMDLLDKSEEFDASKYAGFEYYYKGDAHALRIETNDITDYDFHVLESPKKLDWTKVIVDFNDIYQEGWGIHVDLDKSKLWKLSWVIKGATNDTGSFSLDNIQFLEKIEYEIENNMVINDPEIPTETVMGDVEVTTSLNTLTMKYLNKGLNFTNWLEQDKLDYAQDPADWTFTRKDVERHAQQGFLSLRLPVDLDLYVINRDSVIAGQLAFTGLEDILYDVLDSFDIWTSDNNMSLTIDYHQYDGSFNGVSAQDSAYREMAANVWKAVANHFSASVREDLFYELNNEPDLNADTKITQADWKTLAQQMIDSIRTVDTQRAIIFGDVEYYSIEKLISSTPFTDDKIIYAFHFYDPFIYTHMGASWADMGNTRNIPFPYTKEEWSTEYRYFGINDATPAWIKSNFKNYYKTGNKIAMKNRIIKVKEWAYLHQVPLVCNEFGAYQKNAKNIHLNNYNRTMGEIFKELDIAWQVWFGIFDDEGNLLDGVDESMELVSPTP